MMEKCVDVEVFEAMVCVWLGDGFVDVCWECVLMKMWCDVWFCVLKMYLE